MESSTINSHLLNWRLLATLFCAHVASLADHQRPPVRREVVSNLRDNRLLSDVLTLRGQSAALILDGFSTILSAKGQAPQVDAQIDKVDRMLRAGAALALVWVIHITTDRMGTPLVGPRRGQ